MTVTHLSADFRDQADAFYEHLNKCKQCEEHPFDLCAEGQALMVKLKEALEQPCEKE